MNMVRIVREAKGIMQKDVVALAAGLISPHRLRCIEKGEGRKPKPHERATLAHILDMDERNLFQEPGTSQRRPPAFPKLPKAPTSGIVRRPYKNVPAEGKERKLL